MQVRTGYHGFGLMGIRERVSMGGNFRIFSKKERHKLFIDIPCLKGDDKSWKIL
jgi:glucose-6-phosphate-specific signal transduction histidine kinase